MTKNLPTYLHSLRKIWALTQRELAFLLRISPDHLAAIERGERNPTLSAVLGAEIVFGKPPRAVFPLYYDRLEVEVMQRAAALHERLHGRNDRRSKEKRRLLADMIDRAEPLRTEV